MAPPLFNLFDELAWRDLVYDATEGVQPVLAAERVSGYAGFDPTAASLHVGSLLPLMGLARLQRAGHRPVALLGGGTGLVGDPSGKTRERQLLSREQAAENLAGIEAQIRRFLDFEAGECSAVLVDNAEWIAELRLMDFLRDIGKHFTVNALLAKDSVKRRLEGEEGLSITEFSYSLLQAYDFLVLYDRFGCRLQIGGSDQWGNIVAGIDLIRRLRGERAYGLVQPLVTTAAGVKFGKTEAGAVWLDASLTSPFRFYQFWVNTDDRDVIRYLKYFTWLRREEVGELAAELETAPEARGAHRRLAAEVTRLVHGADGLAAAEAATEVLFGGEVTRLPLAELLDVFSDVPSIEVDRQRLGGDGLPLVDLLAESGAVPSKGEARRALRGGGIYLNNRRVTDEWLRVTAEDAVEGQLLVLRKGKKQYHLVRLV